jgi:purine-binding chemotaxis protein CheW
MEQKNDDTNSYLTFKLGKEEFGAHVSQVLNILEMSKITAVPKTPDYMKGVINLRGMVLPIIDTRIKFGMAETEYTNNTCIIVMDLEIGDDTIHIGAIVDEVISVLEIDHNQIEPPPGIGDKYQSKFIYGMARNEDQFIMLLDMQRVLDNDELVEIKEVSKENSKAGV